MADIVLRKLVVTDASTYERLKNLVGDSLNISMLALGTGGLQAIKYTVVISYDSECLTQEDDDILMIVDLIGVTG